MIFSNLGLILWTYMNVTSHHDNGFITFLVCFMLFDSFMGCCYYQKFFFQLLKLFLSSNYIEKDNIASYLIGFKSFCLLCILPNVFAAHVLHVSCCAGWALGCFCLLCLFPPLLTLISVVNAFNVKTCGQILHSGCNLPLFVAWLATVQQTSFHLSLAWQ